MALVYPKSKVKNTDRRGTLLIRALAILPLPLLYVIADAIFLLLFYLSGFHRDLVRNNLRRSFPDMSEGDIRKLSARTYRNSVQLLFEGIKAINISREALAQRVSIQNPERVDSLLSKYPVVIAVGAHYGNWEWLQLACTSQLDHAQITLFKPLEHQGINEILATMRSRFGGRLIDSGHALHAVARFARTGGVIALNADQAPQPDDEKYWCTFLNQQTAFFPGVEKLARMFKAPVMYVHTRRIRRGHYCIAFECLAEPPYPDTPDIIMQAYVKKLEQHINASPEDWVWVYKRWKYTKPSL